MSHRRVSPRREQRIPTPRGDDRDDVIRRLGDIFARNASFAAGLREIASELLDVYRATDVSFSLLDEPLDIGAATPRARVEDLSLIAVLSVGSSVVGSMELARTTPAFGESDLRSIESIALFIGARVHDEVMTQREERYERLAFTDGLTGIANRRKFDDTLASEWKRAQRSRTPLAIVMMDIDFFKVFNDTYGHQGGDRCLKEVAAALQARVTRAGDLLARYGGEEIVALLPDTPLSGAIALAEDFRAAVARVALRHEGSTLGRVSLSLGAASIVPPADADADTLLHLADDALYVAKEHGRNRLVAEGYESEAEHAERSSDLVRGSLPAISTSLIGRARELADLEELLHAQRVVTIAGAGGTGKTRIAVAAATTVEREHRHGAHFIDLSPIAQPELVAATVGAAFDTQLPSNESAIAALVTALSRRDALIILDNCEHVVQAASAVVDALIDGCPQIRVLATSREPLDVRDQYVYRLPPLELEDAVALFTERAKAARREFVLTSANRNAVEEICRFVDGMALAIELAAARIAVVAPEALAERLRENLPGISAGRRTAHERHQTMRALIDWSYGLLSDSEQRVIRRLAIFNGGWTLDAVAGVCALDDVEPFDAFDLHAALLDKSLIAELADGRYRLLEPVRAVMKEKLAAAAEGDVVSRAHVAWFSRKAAEADDRFYTTPSREWFASIAPDIDNYRSAVRFAIFERGAVVDGAALVGSLSWYLYYIHPVEGVTWLRAALDALHGFDDHVELEARIQLGLTPLYLLPPDEKRIAGERAVELYRRIDDPLRLGHALRLLGLTLAWYFPSERTTAAALIDEALEQATRLGDTIAIALTLQAKSQVLPQEDLQERRRLKEEALALLRTAGNDRQLAVVLTDLSEGAFAEGNEAQALSYGHEALRYAQASGSKNTIMVAAANLAHYAAGAKDAATAHDTAALVLRLADETRSPEFVTYGLHALAVLDTQFGDYQRAAQLFGFCNERYRSLHTPRHEGMSEDRLYRRSLAAIDAHLGAAETQRLLAEGATLDEDQALRLTTSAS